MARKLKKINDPADVSNLPAPTPDTAPEKPQVTRARAFAIEAARSLADDHCEDVIVLDVRGLSQVCDFITIGSGSSDVQMRSAAESVSRIGREQGHPAARKNVDERTTWYVVDFVDVLVHVFEPNTRAYYDIEMMWGDAPRVDWQRTEPAAPKRRSRVTVSEPKDGEASA